MSVTFELKAEPRGDLGKGASRRLRRAGQVPAILYGGGQEPQPLVLSHLDVLNQLKNDAVYSHVLTLKLGDRVESVVLRDLQRQRGMALILITHDLAAVSQMADKMVVLYCGRIVERGSTARLIRSPAHHYTRGLLDSIPHDDRSQRRLHQIPGSVPNIRKLPPGCAFAPRCPAAQPLCREIEPVLTEFAPGQATACHFPLEAKL